MSATNKTRQPKKQAAFLAAYSECGNITQAAEIAGIARAQHYQWMKEDPNYPAQFEEAHQQACDRLEQEARRRAVEGWEEPVYYKGEKVGAVRKYSDTLLIFLAKGAMPDKYKERTYVENTGTVKHDVTHNLNLSNLSEDELANLEAILAKAEEAKEAKE